MRHRASWNFLNSSGCSHLVLLPLLSVGSQAHTAVPGSCWGQSPECHGCWTSSLPTEPQPQVTEVYDSNINMQTVLDKLFYFA